MTNTKIILLIGRSGRGKSTLANVASNTNDFKESSGSASETKKIQIGEFDPEQEKLNELLDRLNNLSSLGEEDKQVLQEYLKNKEKAKYLIIDTPGIGDTKMSDKDVLNIIAEAIYLGRGGISQVFFVIDGRFDQYEMATYDLLRTILFDEGITKHTTVVRTRFEKFKKEKECKEDVNLMIKEAREKRVEIDQGISIKEKELAMLSSDNAKYQELLAGIEKAKKELVSTNLAEILESCQGRIVYVDNPSINIAAADDEGENKRERREKLINLNKKTRTKSREKLLKHLNENCQGEFYNPPNLKKLSNEIKEMGKLKTFWISDTDLDSGLEYLSDSVEDFRCSAGERKGAKCQVIYELLENLEGKSFPQKLQAYKQKLISEEAEPRFAIESPSEQIAETTLQKLIASAKDKLASKSFFPSKAKEREEKLNLLFDNLPATSEEFKKSLDSVKNGLGEKLTSTEINDLYQAKQELIELQSKQQPQILQPTNLPPKK